MSTLTHGTRGPPGGLRSPTGSGVGPTSGLARAPRTRDCSGSVRSVLLRVLLALVLIGCTHVRPPKVPGETDTRVREVRFVSEGGQALSVPLGDFRNFLAQRAGGVIQTHRYFNPYRVAEDRRRVLAFWQNRGFFDATVTEGERAFHELKGGREVTLTWVINEGAPFSIASLAFQGFPSELEAAVRPLARFEVGAAVDLERYRLRRWEMAEVLQRAGYAHASVLSRAWVDRGKREVHWRYIADPGPLTTVGTVRVVGAHRVSADDIVRRAGLVAGEPYGKMDQEAARLDLLDTGSFYNVVVNDGADVILNIGIPPPDSGGVVPDERIREDGSLVPRELPSALDITLSVIEAPRVKGRFEGGVEFDPARLDGFVGAEAVMPDLLGSMHHLTARGQLGYGWFWAEDGDHGLDGAARLRTTHVGVLGRLGDLRVTAQYEDRRFGSGASREAAVGPGGRATLAPGLFVELDLLYAFAQERGLSGLDAEQRSAVTLSDGGDAHNLRVQAGVIWDRRDDPVEARKGHLVAARIDASVGAPVGTHRWLTLALDLRKLFPVGDALAVGLRAAGSFIVLTGDEGVPLGARLLGGGAWGFRGFGREAFGPEGGLQVGGLGLFESSVELRWLPFVQQVGASLWADLGAVSATANPFEDGVGLAAGLGLRVRLWHVPLGLDFGYRILDRGRVVPGDTFEPYQFFFRVGESF